MPTTKVSIIVLFTAALLEAASCHTANESQKAIKDLCQNTDNPQICIDSLSIATNASDTKTLIQVSFQLIIKEVDNVIREIDEIRKSSNDPAISGPQGSYATCQLWLGRSTEDLHRAVDEIGSLDTAADLAVLTDDIQTYLSGASTYHTSCMDCFDEDPTGANRVGQLLNVARALTVNGLALANGFTKLLNQS